MGVYRKESDDAAERADKTMYRKREYDLEVYKDGTWYLYWYQKFITKGKSRTRLGRSIRVYFAILWYHIKGMFGKV